ncbi:DUF58 domain-containing protein [Neolewinella lacunae]|uniref:DUF58 domain-containing protein n=1 Tax=Neolewinella lacunae TaxID=1517758 RepID=A0A923TAQ7_9BACT|nr:DUF58 domain-containing protein [Neolewinella lacunae]MBC6996448.1 DUF58 domain-containing protein [Neolewinella lacunae]MDN3633609.1 DUF58 domain-containing protein [Neolewinella lacunae]
MQNWFKPIYEHLRHLYLGNRFFVGLGAVILSSAVGFYWSWLFYLAIAGLVALLGALVFDTVQLYRMAGTVEATRRTPRVFSLGDRMPVRVLVSNRGTFNINAALTDELPPELQIRDHYLPFELPAGEDRELSYPILPLSRGEYQFGNLNIFLKTNWRLAERRLEFAAAQVVPVYPSILQMNQFALQAKTTVPAPGRRRLRRLAKSYEFDQIKEYVKGDDFRSINWKATSRHNALMINQYEDERAQRVFCCIDKGRTMLMPFNGLSLLDYAINATLALSNVILTREDRAGLITFSDKIGTVLPADSKPDQLRRIMEALYRQQDRQRESNYDLLYYASRKLLGGRSLIILFTNFESNYALDRVLPGLRRISKSHQLVVILFENTEIAELLDVPTGEVEDVYRKSTARRFLQQRELMAARLRQNGVNVVLTRPEDLTGAVINKYLELKKRGLA